MSVIERAIPAAVHGHYWLRPARPEGPAGGEASLLVGFHGYGEDGEGFLESLERIPGAASWHLVSVQGLHPFYTRDGRVVAGWMTRFDRELAIADNTAYARAAVEAARSEVRACPAGPERSRRKRAERAERATPTVVFAGFSQGVAMAYRAAAAMPARGLIALAGDVPPEVDPSRLPPVLIGRGRGDSWYDDAKLAADLDRLTAAGVPTETCVFEGGHEWTPEFYQAAGAFLERLRGRASGPQG